MAKLYIFNENTGSFEPSPTLPVMDEPNSLLIWSDRRFVAAAAELCSRFELAVSRSFSSAARGRCAGFSAHYAGLAANFVPLGRDAAAPGRLWDIRKYCINSRLFTYVEPPYSTPGWLHAELSVLPPSSLTVPYPVLKTGESGVHVFLLQSCLNALGFCCLMNGMFGEDTLKALMKFAKNAAFSTHGIVTSECWKAIFYQLKTRPHQR